MPTIDWTRTCLSCQYCCTYIALEIDPPRTDTDHDVIRWYLAHKLINLYLDHENSWYLLVNTPCENLTPQGCGIYENRFNICRDYDPAVCEMSRGEVAEKVLFRTVEDFDLWLGFRQERERTSRRRRPPGSRARRMLKGHLRPAPLPGRKTTPPPEPPFELPGPVGEEIPPPLEP